MMDVRNSELPIWRTTTRILGLLARNFIPFCLLSAVFQIPGVLFTQSQPAPDPQNPTLRLAELWFMFVNMFIQSVLVGTITHSVLEQLQGRRGVIFESFIVGLGRIFSIYAVNLCVFFSVMVGFMLLLLPGFIATAMFAVAVPVMLVERPGVLGALRRSRELTRGNRLRILGLGAMIVGVIYGALIFVFILVGFRKMPDLQSMQLYFVFVGAFLGLVITIGEAVTYDALRKLHARPHGESLADVFD